MFTRSAATWTQQVTLAPDTPAPGELFGHSVSLDGDSAIVGAYGDDELGANAGAAYVFARSANAWPLETRLTASDAAAGDFFGRGVALSGDLAVMGGGGRAYAFVRSAGAWTEEDQLVPSAGAAAIFFGYNATLDGQTALFGAHGENISGTSSGAAYVFTRSASAWSETGKLVPADGAPGDNFGTGISLSGHIALVGAHKDDDMGADSGSAYVFARSAGIWSEDSKLTASDGATNDLFGSTVSATADGALVGAYRDDDNGTEAGAVYAFEIGNLGPGMPCAVDSQCASDASVDDVCCDTPCGGGLIDDCLACSIGAGAPGDGTCASLDAVDCDDDLYCNGADTCQSGSCS